MTGNYFKVGIRILMRQKGYALLNVLGLMLGIVVFVFIYLYLASEIKFDRYWADNEQIYRITNEFSLDGRHEKIALTPFRLANDLITEFPEVEKATNLFFTDPSDENDVSAITRNNEVFEVPDISLSDNSFFGVFNYPFLEGHPDSALIQPNSIVISAKTALEIFKGQPALGQTLRTILREYTVTGVIDKANKPSHLNFDALVSVSSLTENERQMLASDYFWMTCYTYVKLLDTVDYRQFEYRFNEFERKGEAAYVKEEKLNVSGSLYYFLEPLNEVHFNTSLLYDSPTNVVLGNLYIFGIIALFILLTASINYINLATARSLKRSREIGMRKVLGAKRLQLVVQYVTESLIITSIAFILALALVEWMMPYFNNLVGKQLSLSGSLFSGEHYLFGLVLISLVFLLSVVGGSFPAFVLSSFKPAVVLRGSLFAGKQHLTAGAMRHFLVIVQYVVSIGMITATLIVYSQLDFLRDHDLGFNEENVLVINVPHDSGFRARVPEIVQTLQSHSSILQVASTQNVPGFTEGKLLFQLGDTNANPVQTIGYFGVGYNFFRLLDIQLVEGRYFMDKPGPDTVGSFILNEAAVDFLGLDTVIGSSFNYAGKKGGKIVGVVKNFNSSSLHRNVEPLVFLLNPERARYIMVRHADGKNPEAEAFIRTTWKGNSLLGEVHFISLDEKLTSLYNGDKKMLNLFFYFSLFVVFISSLGLYGLSSFLIQQRSREIGIRRVLGGTYKQLTWMLALGYLKLVLLSGLIAAPLVYYLMNQWLSGFAYQIDLHFGFFVSGILLALLIAFFTVFTRSVKVIKEELSVSLRA